jgi:hypothetical protein
VIDDQANSGLRPIRVRLKRYVRDLDATRLEGGGSQPKVFAAEDETLWLVKAMNNPQGIRTLANELVGTSLARRIGGTVPRPAVCDLPTELATDVRFSSGQAWQAGPSFGSELLDSSWQPTHEMLERVINPGALLAVVAADTWLGQFDQRQARAVADEHGGYTIWAVDFGYSIGNPGWRNGGNLRVSMILRAGSGSPPPEPRPPSELLSRACWILAFGRWSASFPPSGAFSLTKARLWCPI